MQIKIKKQDMDDFPILAIKVRLDNNIIIAYKKDGNMLCEDEAFVMMVAGEDNTGATP